MSVVYYGKYFVYFEVARTEYLKNIGFNYADIEKDGYYFVVAESNCKYFSPARYDDDLRIYTRIEYVKNSSFNFIYGITREDKAGEDKNESRQPERQPQSPQQPPRPPVQIASGSTVLVCIGKEDFRPRRIPEYIRSAVRSFEGLV